MAETLTAATVRADVAKLLHLGPDEILDTEDLFEQGLDSVRLLTLLEHWREAGAQASFADLAEQATLGHWIKVLAVPDA